MFHKHFLFCFFMKWWGTITSIFLFEERYIVCVSVHSLNCFTWSTSSWRQLSRVTSCCKSCRSGGAGRVQSAQQDLSHAALGFQGVILIISIFCKLFNQPLILPPSFARAN